MVSHAVENGSASPIFTLPTANNSKHDAISMGGDEANSSYHPSPQYDDCHGHRYSYTSPVRWHNRYYVLLLVCDTKGQNYPPPSSESKRVIGQTGRGN
jgi:hypothetical protein